MRTHGTARFTRRIESALRSVLPPAVDLRVVGEWGSSVDLKVAGHKLRVRWVDATWPSAIRQMLKEHGQPPDLVVAEQLSAGTREELSKMGIGWVDELGAAEISIGTLLVSRSGRAPEVKRIRGWTSSVVAVAEAMLCNTTPTVAATRAATGLSIGTCTNALRALTEMGFLAARSPRGRTSARSVVNADDLLAAYATAVASSKPPLSVIVGVTWRDPIRGVTELGHAWTRAGVEWAATGLVAAGVMAPLQTTIGSATVYLGAESIPELMSFAAKVDLVPVEGGRLTLAAFPTSASWCLVRSVEDMRVAPWPRVYVDLRAIGVRGEEAAEHLREVVSGS
jgi:hypothetical protein